MITRRSVLIGVAALSTGCTSSSGGSSDGVSDQLESTPTESPTPTPEANFGTESPTPTPKPEYEAVIRSNGVVGRVTYVKHDFLAVEFLFARFEDSPDQFRARTMWTNTSENQQTPDIVMRCRFYSKNELLRDHERTIESIEAGDRRPVDYEIITDHDQLDNFEIVIGTR